MSTTEIFNALPAGYTLQEYRIEAMLGVGGFGLTYLAHDGNLNTKVAIKEYLPADFATRSEDQSVGPKTASVQESFAWGLKRFLEESRTLASFRHPNIVRVMRFFEANRTAYMVMEFIAGKPLNEWVKTCTTLDEAGLTRIAAPLLDGLEVIHQAGYLHRDIKPPNIFIRDDNSPILIDFGSARMKVNADQNLTAIVSPGFSPLEQYHVHGKQGAWTDLYSLAGVLYWLATGKKPFEAAAREREDTMPTAVAIGRRGYYSEKFLAAIDWALKPCEQDRPQSVAEFRAALIAAAPAARDAAPAPEKIVSPTSVPIHATFEPSTLKRVEAELAAHLGPIAGVIVKNAAKKVATVPALAHLLAPEISDLKARAAFVRKFSSDNSMPPSQPGQGARMTSSSALVSEKSSASALQRFNAETLRRAEVALAQYIGAVAKVVVKHAAQKARDENELYLLLGDEIADKAERKSFVRRGISIAGKN
jgi:serine/threonine protein kinase